MSHYLNKLILATAIFALLLCINVSTVEAEVTETQYSSQDLFEVRQKAFGAMNNREAEYFEAVNDLLYLLGRRPLELKQLKELKDIIERETNKREPLLSVPNRIRADYLLQNYGEAVASDLANLRLSLSLGSIRLPDSEIRKLFVFISGITCDTKTEALDKQYILQYLTDRFKDSLPSSDLAFLNFNVISQSANFTDRKAESALAQLKHNYDKPYRRIDFQDRALLVATEKVIDTGEKNNKREFLVKDSLLAKVLFNQNTAQDLQPVLKKLVDLYSLLQASTQARAAAFTYLGCAYLKTNNFAEACTALESANELLTTIPDSMTTFVAKIALLSCYQKMGRNNLALKVADEVSLKSCSLDYSCAFEACCQTLVGQIYLHQGKNSKALKYLKEADEWYRCYPNRSDQLPYGYDFLRSIIPQEEDMLKALVCAYRANGKQKLANNIETERQKIISNLQEEKIDTENRRREFTGQGEISELEGKRIRGADFNAEACATLGEAIESSATRAFYTTNPYELRNYCESLIKTKDFKRAQAILLASMRPNEQNSPEDGAMLAFCFFKSGHPLLAESTIEQLFNNEYQHATPIIASLKRARSTAALFCYAAKIAAAQGQSIRAERFAHDCKMWINSDELKNSDFAQLISVELAN